MLKWLTFDPDYSKTQDISGSGFAKYCFLDPEQEKAMLDGALKLLLTLLVIQTHRGMKSIICDSTYRKVLVVRTLDFEYQV